MNTSELKKALIGVALAIAMVLMSSCNRGIGCPSEFSAEQDTAELVTPT